MKGFIIYPDYISLEDQTYVQLFGKLENGQSFVTLSKLNPYFFISEEDFKKISNLLNSYTIEKTSLTNFKEKKVVKISAKNHLEINKLAKEIHKAGIHTYESDLKPHYRFIIDKDILGSIEIEGDYESSEKVDRIYKEPKITPVEFFPKLKILSLDIESDKNSDKLFCIGLYSEDYKKNFIVSEKKLEHAISCSSESECLEKFKEEIIKLDPDIITGWNVINFDFVYLDSLFKKYKIPFDIGRNNDALKLRIESEFFRHSSIDIPGRQVLDGLNLIKDPFIKEAPSIKNAEFESYTLEDVAQVILKDGKLIKGKNRHEEIERLYKTNQQKLVDYNLQDCKLAYEIVEKTKMIELAIGRSHLTGMPLDKLTSSIIAFDSLYIREARKAGLVSPSTSYGLKEERIKGGYVYSLKSGIYHNVLLLDFKSLYPSIIRTFNIDPSSHLEKKEKNAIESPNKEYFKNKIGVLPKIIEKLHQAREKAKKEKQELSNYAIKIIMNSFFGVLASPNCRYFNLGVANAITHFGQSIIKLTAKKIEEKGYRVIYSDSVDGKTSIIIRKNNKITEEPIESLFTEVNQKNLGKEYNFKKNIEVLTLDEKGNSVFRPIKYVMRHKTNKKMYRINFTNNWYIDVTEDHSLIGYQSLAFNNKKQNILNPLNRLIEIKPNEIGKKASTVVSLKKIPSENVSTKNLPKEVYEFMGYFIGDGSFHRNNIHKRANKDYYLALSLGLDKEEVIEKLINPLKNMGYIRNYWLSKTRKGDITINGLKIVEFIAKQCRGEDNKKTIPSWLFEEKEENIASFLRGLFSADGCVMIRSSSPIIKYTSISDIYIEKVRKLLYKVGISHSVFKENNFNKYNYKDKIYTANTHSKNIIIQNKDIFAQKIGFILDRKNKLANIKTDGTKKRHIKNFEFDIQAVKKIEDIKTPDYVYDIEVEGLHRFFANYVLVHNTDSCFVESGISKEEADKLGIEIQDYVNNFYKKYVKEEYQRDSALEIEFDKQYLSMMIPNIRGSEVEKAAKKRYAGLIEKDGKEELEIVGLEAIRGDWTEAAQEFQRELLTKVFKKEPFEQFIKAYVKKIISGKLDDKLVYRKSIRKELEEYTKTTPPHVKAARQLDSLDSNIIEYYITLKGPEPIQKLKHKIDYEHYINKQILPIANQVLSLFNKSFEEIVQTSKQAKLF